VSDPWLLADWVPGAANSSPGSPGLGSRHAQVHRGGSGGVALLDGADAQARMPMVRSASSGCCLTRPPKRPSTDEGHDLFAAGDGRHAGG